MSWLVTILYAAYLYVCLDQTKAEPLLNGRITVTYIFSAVLLVILFFSNRLMELKITRRDGFGYLMYGSLILLFIFNMLRSTSDLQVGLQMIAFLSVSFLMAAFVRRKDTFDRFVWVSFLVSAIYVLVQFFKAESPFEVYANLGSIFSEERFRMDFGFTQVNSAGCMGSCVLVLSIFVFASLIPRISRIWLRVLTFVTIAAMDFFVLTFLLATGSRNSILSFIICLVVFLYYRISVSSKITRTLRFWLRLLVLVTFILLLVTSLGEKLISLFVSSNRMKNFTDNLPILDTPLKWVFGIGTVGAGFFVNENYNVDNAYLYYLLTTGLVGMILLIVLLFWLGIRLRRKILNASENKDSRLVVYIFTFAVLVSHVISGMGELCVLYYLFPSSMIFFTLYFAADMTPNTLQLHQEEAL